MRKILLALCLMLPLPLLADVVVIVNASNPVKSMSAEDVSSLYLAQTKTFSGGEYALVFDHPRNSEVRQRFFRLVAGMGIAQVNAYWSRLMFSGQETPPQPLPGEQAIIDIVRRNSGAIGYVGHVPKDPGVKIVLHLKD